MPAHYPDIVETAQPASLSVIGFGLHRPQGLYRSGIKRMIDIIVVAATAVITAPLIILIALFVSLDGHSPFYSQRRLGMGGRSFTLWKLRSMVPDADTRLREHLSADPAARAEWDRTQKLMNDPRITRMGRFIRKCSIDELPQLWNVLRGDMSLVGPRPMMPEQASLYPGISYFALRPGITGTWQVSARNESSFAERARFDSDYYRSVSLGTDLGILLATVRVVVRGTGH